MIFDAETFYKLAQPGLPDKYINPMVELYRIADLVSVIRFYKQTSESVVATAPTIDTCLMVAVEMWKHINPLVDFPNEVEF